jgi:hypothetical protein
LAASASRLTPIASRISPNSGEHGAPTGIAGEPLLDLRPLAGIELTVEVRAELFLGHLRKPRHGSTAWGVATRSPSIIFMASVR